MSCDYTAYNNANTASTEKSVAAQEACDALSVAKTEQEAANAKVAEATAAKNAAYDEWQIAQQAENAEAAKLGIEPCPEAPPEA